MKRVVVETFIRAATDKILGTVRLTSDILSRVNNSAISPAGVKKSVVLKASNIEELKNMPLEVGDTIEVQGNLEPGDGNLHRRIISSKNDGSGIQLLNGFYANILKGSSSFDFNLNKPVWWNGANWIDSSGNKVSR